MSLVCWNLKVFLQFGLSLGKRQTNLLICQGYKKKNKQTKTNFSRLQNLDLLRPGLVKGLQPHIPMSKWSYFKALYHRIHNISLSMSKNRKQKTWAKRFPG